MPRRTLSRAEAAFCPLQGSTDFRSQMIDRRSERSPVRLPLLLNATATLSGGCCHWRWGESNPRPRARTASVYRFIRPIELSGRGQRAGAPSLPYPWKCPRALSGKSLGEPRSVTNPTDAQGGATAGPSLSALTRRERDCRCCWQLKVCRIRRSAAPPATRDPDRSGRDRCTPVGDGLVDRSL
jgi:hypothetical protein